MEILITSTADHRARQVGNFERPKVGRFRGPLTAGRAAIRPLMVCFGSRAVTPKRLAIVSKGRMTDVRHRLRMGRNACESTHSSEREIGVAAQSGTGIGPTLQALLS